MKTKLIISGLAFLAITTLASGQNNGVNSPPQNSTGKGRAYVDANNNGICDNYENRTSNNSSGRRLEIAIIVVRVRDRDKDMERDKKDGVRARVVAKTLSMQIKMVYATIMILLPKSKAYFSLSISSL